MKLKETDADIRVKERLWDATIREVTGFAERFAAGHEVGVRYSDQQRDVARSAKRRGYPIGIVRAVAQVIRIGDKATPKRDIALAIWRDQIGL